MLYQLPNGHNVWQDGFIEFNVSQMNHGLKSIDYSGKSMVIANFSALGIPPGMPFEPKYFNGIECVLWFCVQAWQISVTAGLQHRTVLADWGEGIWDGSEYSEYNFTNIPSDFNVVPGTRFSVNLRALNAAKNAFKSLNGTWHAGSASGNDLVDGLYESFADPYTWIRRLALSMTNALILAKPATNDPYYAATVTASMPYIRVRWWWLTFPVAMVLTSLFFFLTIAWQTRARNVQAWKSNPFALLFCSVDEDIKRESIAYVDEFDGLPSHVESRRMLLKKDGNYGWVLTAA